MISDIFSFNPHKYKVVCPAQLATQCVAFQNLLIKTWFLTFSFDESHKFHKYESTLLTVDYFVSLIPTLQYVKTDDTRRLYC